LASQLPGDFGQLTDIATSTLILDAGNESTRGDIQSIFGLSNTEVAALKQYVHGPQAGGMTFLAKIKTKSAELSQLFTSTSGGLELWGLTTTAEDRALRNKLYRLMPSAEARAVLKKRFPRGSCKSYVLGEKAKSREERGENFVDDDPTSSIIETLAESIFRDWKKSQDDAAA
jgi:intracellular multiplication protein IcmB